MSTKSPSMIVRWHAIPDKPAAGQLGGKPFAPTAEIQGEALTFRTAGPDMNTEREIVIKFSPELAKKIVSAIMVKKNGSATSS